MKNSNECAQMCVCVCVGEPVVEVRPRPKPGAFLWRLLAQRHLGHHRRPLSDAGSHQKGTTDSQTG